MKIIFTKYQNEYNITFVSCINTIDAQKHKE